MPTDDTHSTSEVRDNYGRLTSKSIQGRALDPDANLAVADKMKSTDLGALARAAAAKKAASAGKTTGEVQRKALTPPSPTPSPTSK